MFRKILFVGLALAATTVPIAHATDASVAVNQSFNANVFGPGYGAAIYINNENSVTDTGGPSQVAKAGGYLSVCNPTCSFLSFPQQSVPTDALSADLLGNTVTVNACLVPSSGPPCKTFSFTAARPKYFQKSDQENPWWDPSGPAAHADASASLARSQYDITGTFPGVTLPDPNYFVAMNSYTTLVSANVNLG